MEQQTTPLTAAEPGLAVIRHTAVDGHSRWLRFANPVEIIAAHSRAEVIDALQSVEAAVRRGRYAAGFISYEAAPAFDSALRVNPQGPLPLLWFGLYEKIQESGEELNRTNPACALPTWKPSVAPDEYRDAIARIKELIAGGETYQVNYSLRLRSEFRDSAWALFRQLYSAQNVPCAAFVDTGDHAICSASPELFFELDGERITCRPMKGTAPRGLAWSDDENRAAALQQSEKNRAENIMIVDMMRNDLGRIARAGSISVPHLFEIERYRTLFQMTSTVTALTDASLPEIFRALFPCSSVTGAPKVRTMQIIAELEKSPRGIYTGAIGFMAPGRKARFNVAIRTVHVDKKAGLAEYGIGSGIVWDSDTPDEYDECLIKGAVLMNHPPEFSLLETLLWTRAGGFFLLEEHFLRLRNSAEYFGFRIDAQKIQRQLLDEALAFDTRTRVRLLVDENGDVRIEHASLVSRRRVWRVALANQPVDPANRFLHHKTTNRSVYEEACAAFPEHDDVILWNARREVTESSIANIVVRRDGRLITPPVDCGLLPGVYRKRLLEKGRIHEGRITIDELARADAIFLVNSVRGWIPCRLS
jgi:para-aminobenzoate synthetase/4-amino-4-deoxychorismate lyase